MINPFFPFTYIIFVLLIPFAFLLFLVTFFIEGFFNFISSRIFDTMPFYLLSNFTNKFINFWFSLLVKKDS